MTTMAYEGYRCCTGHDAQGYPLWRYPPLQGGMVHATLPLDGTVLIEAANHA
jgi:hypothetical protein